MDSKLIEVAQKGDVPKLRNLIRDDPLLLKAVALAGGETPLHIACLGGHVDFVKEVLNLSPEFATVLNQDGFSPLHIAASSGVIENVKELLKIGSHLCLVKGKERRLPLHYAVARGRTEVIQELLAACLDSFSEVTARGETCLHLAVKENQFEAFKVLVDHAISHNKEQILNVKDRLGNSVLHIATFRKQYEVICVLLEGNFARNRYVEVNSLNKRGHTPLDILALERGDVEIEEMLRAAGCFRVEEMNSLPSPDVFAIPHDTLPTQSGQGQVTHQSKRPSSKLQEFFKYDKIKDTPCTVRNTLLVIAVLITAATYQPILSPPGGIWQDDYFLTSNTSGPAHTAGKAVMGTHYPVSYGLFLLFNSIGFFMSLHMLNFLTLGLPLQFELRVAILALALTYDTCMYAITSIGKVYTLFVVMATVMPMLMPTLTVVVRDYRKPQCGAARSSNVA